MATDPDRNAERQAWIALSSTPGVGDVTFARLLAVNGSAAATLRTVARMPARRADAEMARILAMRQRPGLARAIRAAAADPGRVERRMREIGGWVLTPLDAAFPSRLHELEDPPTVLFGLGSTSSLARIRSVAVVGTRRPTALGRHLASRIGARLAEARISVVSGLAVGVDGAAHLGALDAAGETVAVVGGGLDEPGPIANRRLARAIARAGAVVSELAPGVQASRGTFPRRNRIISALAAATIVVEAPARSGALITARHALEQGRLLLVATGRPLDPAVAGNLALLRESPGRPLVGLDEMLVDLELEAWPGSQSDAMAAGDASALGTRLSADAALELLGPPQRSVALALSTGPHTVDGLVRASGQSPGVVAAALTLLQLRGWARVLGALQLPAGPLLADATDRTS